MADVGLAWDAFFRSYGSALSRGDAAVFAGAGLSRAAGHVDWRGLLQEFADELGIDLDYEVDLVSVAQYHLNAAGGQRARLNQKIVDEFGVQRDITPAHETLARLPIESYWTTNYDNLIERALEAVDRQPQIIAAASAMTTSLPESDATVFKLHGDLSDPGNIVITRDDYEEYIDKRAVFRQRLQAELVARTFLFVGFSFTDPHLDFLLGELRRVNRNGARAHFLIAKKVQEEDFPDDLVRYQREATRQRLRTSDLERYGLSTVFVDDYSEVPVVLEQLRLRYLRRQVFVSGAACDFSPRGREWLDEMGMLLGEKLVQAERTVVSGFGLSIGGPVVYGAIRAMSATGDRFLQRRLMVRPFPVPPEGETPDVGLYRQHRQSLLATAGFAVFVSGNRESVDGVELSPGVREEFDLALDAGVLPLPVGSTGWVASELWTEVNKDVDRFLPEHPNPDAWATLNDRGASPAGTVDALLSLIEQLTPAWR